METLPKPWLIGPMFDRKPYDLPILYSPLANSTYGRAVAGRNGIPPYVDASCRREPDFELASPFISGLCRPHFIAALAVGDLLVYVTKKSTVHREGRRLVAVLQLNPQDACG